MMIDGHRVDPELSTQPAQGQRLEALFVGDPQRDAEDLLASDDGGSALASGGAANPDGRLLA